MIDLLKDILNADPPYTSEELQEIILPVLEDAKEKIIVPVKDVTGQLILRQHVAEIEKDGEPAYALSTVIGNSSPILELPDGRKYMVQMIDIVTAVLEGLDVE